MAWPGGWLGRWVGGWLGDSGSTTPVTPTLTPAELEDLINNLIDKRLLALSTPKVNALPYSISDTATQRAIRVLEKAINTLVRLPNARR